MSRDGDLEIVLRWNRRNDKFEIGVRFDILDDNVEDWLPPGEPIKIDLERLAELRADQQAYGEALTRMVLGGPEVEPFVLRALTRVEGQGRLHVRLHIAAPPRFHAIRWELLRDPRSGQPLATRADVLLSRYLNSPDWRVIPALAEHELRALIVVAAPNNLGEWEERRFAPVRVEEELLRAQNALRRVPHLQTLSGGKATLTDLMNALENGVDILYLVCHGFLKGDVPMLVLEGPDGSAEVVDGRVLTERLSELERRPTIALLSSCQSAGSEAQFWSHDDGALAALGPRLAAAGVAAVVAMQGDISMETANLFAPAFFESLARNGRVHEAMAAGRRAVQDRRDWWAPVLFSRLRSGRTYYRPAFTERQESTWQSLLLKLSSNVLTPVLGPGLASEIIGSRQEIARSWVEQWQLPISSHDQGDLAKVAQYLRVRGNNAGDVWTRLEAHLLKEMVQRCAEHSADPNWRLPPEKLAGPSPVPAILEVGKRLRWADPGDPYNVMADMEVPIYITTAWTDLLQEALRERDRKPTTLMFPWNYHIQATRQPRIEPTVKNPLVYHLYGRLDRPETLVLNEDDYFHWMNSWIGARKSIPPSVQRALTSSSLLFLGYSLDDWDFRVIFQGIKSFGSGKANMLSQNQHVGVQLSPQSQTIEPEAAQEYLESYFGEDKISIYWGDARQFLDDLRERRARA
nr:CHAT domain-containing protein [uncultured Actinoplanes sp.]